MQGVGGSSPLVLTIFFGGLAQLVRVPASHAGGRAFEPRSLHHFVLLSFPGKGRQQFFIFYRYISILFYTTLYDFLAFIRKKSYNGVGGGSMKPLKEKISITIDSDILQIAKVKAEEDDRSLSQYINVVLKDHFRKARSAAERTS